MQFQITIPDHPPLGRNKRVSFPAWLQYQANRLFVGELRYGAGNRGQKYMTRMIRELEKYAKTGNFENLLNIANYAFLESEFPENPKFHFDPNAASATRKEMGGNIAAHRKHTGDQRMNDPVIEVGEVLQKLCKMVHRANEKWWVDPDQILRREEIDFALGDYVLSDGIFYAKKERNVGEMLMLCVSELAEALEGHRKGLQDDHLPEFDMFTVELADTMIRLLDLAGALCPDFGRAFDAKMEYNLNRADHKLENRLKEGGKKY